MGAAAAVAVAFVVVGIAAVVYVADRSELRGQVDDSLSEVAAPLVAQSYNPPGGPDHYGGGGYGSYGAPPARFGGASGYVQFVHSDGTVERPQSENSPLPVSQHTLVVASGSSKRFFSDTIVDRVHLRVLTVSVSGGALQVARPLSEVDRVLKRLRVVLLVVGLIGIAVAALIGQLVARTALAPVARFTRHTEALTADPDLSHRLDVEGRDELTRLALSFNATLDALEQSVQAQRHLVADASHELRTPIASLRANVQLLTEEERLPAAERDSLRADIIEELDALTALVADVVDLARGSEPREAADDVALDQIVEHALEVARRRAPGIRFQSSLTPTLVRGVPDRIARAVANLLDNAVKWSDPEGRVEVGLSEGVLSVRDHGAGFDEGDLPHVFDRFYRADEARRLPGSGLGLAIVRQTAEAHGGWARASNAEGGGARLEVYFGEPVATPAVR